jgi:hypothetical protein
MSPSPPPDNRFLALRAAGQDASEFALTDDQVRRFMELRDQGAGAGAIVDRLGLDGELVDELVRADEGYAVAHRIAEGELPMYPPPEPSQAVVDARSGSQVVPVLVLVAVLVGVMVYAALR